MGFDIVSMFVGIVMFFCGLVLLLVSRGKRKGGYIIMLLGIIILILAIIFYPRVRERMFTKYQMVKDR